MKQDAPFSARKERRELWSAALSVLVASGLLAAQVYARSGSLLEAGITLVVPVLAFGVGGVIFQLVRRRMGVPEGRRRWLLWMGVPLVFLVALALPDMSGGRLAFSPFFVAWYCAALYQGFCGSIPMFPGRGSGEGANSRGV